jgi:hypothetical protein
MTMDHKTESKEQPSSFLRRKATLTVLGALVLGALGNGLWEILAKPGLTTAGRALLNVATFGSTRIRDSAYASAASDPTPLPALLVLLVVSLIPFYAVLTATEFLFEGRKSRLERAIANLEEIEFSEPEEKDLHLALQKAEQELQRSKRRDKWFNWFGLAFFCFFFIGSLIGFGVINQAVATHRVFYTNLKICAPFISETDEERLEGLFSMVENRGDYLEVQSHLETIAKNNGLKLQKFEPW